MERFINNNTAICHEETSVENHNCISGLRILMCDTELNSVNLLSDILSNFGLEISSCQDYDNSISLIKNNAFDLFIINTNFKRIKSLNLIQNIKNSPLNKQAPIIFITNNTDPETKIEFYNTGCCACIEFPFNKNLVQSQIFSILKGKKINSILQKENDSFFAMVAHDLKTPINAEIMALELLIQNNKEKCGSENEIMNDMLYGAKYMRNLVYNVLHKYNIQNNNISLNKTPCTLKALIEDSICEVKYILTEKNQSISLKNTSQNNIINVDEIEIKRVMHNLLSNAIEYAPNNSNIEIELTENKDYVIVSTKNTAKWELPENIHEIFDKYISFANKSKSVNSGLGLYVAKNIIEAHKGSIKAEKVPPDQIRFTFTLPIS